MFMEYIVPKILLYENFQDTAIFSAFILVNINVCETVFHITGCYWPQAVETLVVIV